MFDMKRIFMTLAASGVATLGVGAIGASAAMAATVTLHEGSTTGAEVKGSEPINAVSTNLVFHTSLGNLECSKSELSGVLTKNKANPVEGEITAGEFTGTEPAPGTCKTSIFNAKFEKLKAAIAKPLSGLPWLLTLADTGVSTITPLGGAAVDFTAELYNAKGSHEFNCTYEAGTLTDKIVKFGAKLEDEVVKQEMARAAGSGSLCPAKGELNGTFTTFTNTNTKAVLFVTMP